MYKNILVILMTIFVWLLPITSNLAYSADTSSPEQVVEEFQKLPHYEMFCNDEKWLGTVLSKFDLEYKKYFSKEFYKLFLWSECVEPATPPHYDGMENDFSYDIRFSIPYEELYIRKKLYLVKDILIKSMKNNKGESFIGVNFTHRKTKKFTRYTLIQEDGQWKIDDISPRSTFVGKREPSDPDGNEIAEYSFSSDSIKAEMQKNYNAAMARYNKEQAQKGIAPK